MKEHFLIIIENSTVLWYFFFFFNITYTCYIPHSFETKQQVPVLQCLLYYNLISLTASWLSSHVKGEEGTILALLAVVVLAAWYGAKKNADRPKKKKKLHLSSQTSDVIIFYYATNNPDCNYCSVNYPMLHRRSHKNLHHLQLNNKPRVYVCARARVVMFPWAAFFEMQL